MVFLGKERQVKRFLRGRVEQGDFALVIGDLRLLAEAPNDSENLLDMKDKYFSPEVLLGLISYAGGVDALFSSDINSLADYLEGLYTEGNNTLEPSGSKLPQYEEVSNASIISLNTAESAFRTWAPLLVDVHEIVDEEYEDEFLTVPSGRYSEDGSELLRDDEDLGDIDDDRDLVEFDEENDSEGGGDTLANPAYDVEKIPINSKLIYNILEHEFEIPEDIIDSSLDDIFDALLGLQEAIVSHYNALNKDVSAYPSDEILKEDEFLRNILRKALGEATSTPDSVRREPEATRDSSTNLTGTSRSEKSESIPSGTTLEFPIKSDDAPISDNDNAHGSSPNKLWAASSSKVMIDLNISEEEEALINEKSPNQLGEFDAGGITGLSYVDLQRDSLRVTKEKFDNNELAQFSLSKKIELEQPDGGYDGINKSLIHPIFKKTSELFSCISIFEINNDAIPSLRDDAVELTDYLELEIKGLLEGLLKGLSGRISNTARGAKEFEIRVEKVNIAVGNAIEAAKVWDGFNDLESSRFDIKIPENTKLVRRMQEGSDIFSLLVKVVKDGSLIHYTGVKVGSIIRNKAISLGGNIDDAEAKLDEAFKVTLDAQICSFLRKSLDVRSHREWSSPFITIQAAVGISLGPILQDATKKISNPFSGAYYISCPVCSKNIRYKNFSSKGGEKKRDKHDYKIREYSLVRAGRQESRGGVTVQHPGGIISAQDLGDHIGVPIDGELIGWQRAKDLMALPNSSDQEKGNRARNLILKSLGGKPLFSADRYISSTKFACPMEDYLIPDGSSASRDCGFSIDVDSVRGAESIGIEGVSSRFQSSFASSSESEDIFEKINKSDILEDKKNILKDYISRKRSGGWNFSNTQFACPCHISPESFSEDDVSDFREKYKNARLLIPHIGFAKLNNLESSSILQDTSSNNSLKWIYQPPTTADGQNKFFSEGSSGYIVCGVSTSISSFVRDKNSELSITSLIKRAVDAGGPNAAEDIIETLLRLGIDIEDVIGADSLFEEDLDKAGRINVLSRIMKSAMAVNIGGNNRELDIINDLGLTCGNGHTFTIGQSVRVGQTHAGTSARGDLLSQDGIFGKSGIDNFKYISEKYFRPVTSTEEMSSLNSIIDTGSSYPGFELSEIKFSSPTNPDEMLSFSRSNRSKLRRKDFVTTTVRDGSSVYSYDPLQREDRESISREFTASYSDVDAGDIAAENSLPTENISAAYSLDARGVVEKIFEMLSGALDTVMSLSKTSQSLDIETVLLNDEKECCDDNISKEIKNIFSSLFRSLGATDGNIDRLFLDIDEGLMDRLKGQKISSIRGYGRSGIEAALTRIVVENLELQFIETIDAKTMNEARDLVSKSVDMLIPRGYEYGDLFPDNPGSSKKIILRRRAEHVGRQIMGGSAIYFADVIVNIFRDRFSKNLSSTMFSGLNIDIDLSSRESILELDFSKIEKLRSIDYLEIASEEFEKNNGDINRLRDSYVDSRGVIRRELIRFRGLVTTQKYMELGAGVASKGVEKALELESNETVDNIKKYIFGKDKIINISLNSSEKHFSGARPGEFVGGYAAPVFVSKNRAAESDIIHALSDGNNFYGMLTEDENNHFKNSGYSRDYMLGLVRGNIPFGCEELPTNTFSQLIGRLDGSVWRPCLVSRAMDGKPPYKLSKNYKLSILNHPNTKMVSVDGGDVHYENIDLNLNTSEGLQLGQQVSSTSDRGTNKLYPPSPYAITGIGIPLPFDYSGSYDRKSGAFQIPHLYTDQEEYGDYKDGKYKIPIQECKAPVDIGLSSGPINAADFMKRSPKYAISIFNEIDEIYNESIKASSSLEGEEARTIIDNAKRRVRQLHDKYRNLPFEIESGKNRSGVAPVGGMRNVGGLYISMWDYATMYKMATWPAYSIEWGGPGRYSDPEGLGKIIGFISNLYNVQSIADALGKKTKQEYTIEDVLSGARKGFDEEIKFASGLTNNISRFYSINPYGDDSDASIMVYADWDYPGSASGGKFDLNSSSYSDRLSKLERVRSAEESDRLSPSDIATMRGFYGKAGGPDSGVQFGPYGETKASDSTLSIYAFTARLRDFISSFALGSSAEKKESAINGNSKFLSKISERKDGLRRIIFMSEVESLLDEIK